VIEHTYISAFVGLS